LPTLSRIFKEHHQLIILTLIIVIFFAILYALRSALLPFVVGAVLAYLLLPPISWAEKRLPGQGKWVPVKRVSLIVLAFIIIFGLAGTFSYYIFTAVINALVTLVDNAPEFLSWTVFKLQEWLEVFRQGLPPGVVTQMDKFLLDAGAALGNTIRDTFFGWISSMPSAFGPILSFGALPIFLFYVLKDPEKLSSGFYSSLPNWVQEHARNIISTIENILGRYIRAQLLLGFIVAYFTFIGLLALKIDYAPALAVVAGITELIPLVGPWIGGAIAVIVTLAIDPVKALWVAVLFLIIQLLENNLLVPRIQGSYLRIHPAVAIVLLIVGGYIWGFWGLLLVLPLTATLVALYRYFRHSMDENKIQ